ncbi:hypothetical protein [Corallococcus terminator]|uniref:Uncharacterized protein n=1 Tax=Corallococcus terminator TaxID=2316733 RepID=A0A3A8IP75_9BACT|nr:hypothetical protein [Corallococcus terminator]RKG84528.1 hypothetical protein D7V88_21660 [Corallococcus terminator]
MPASPEDLCVIVGEASERAEEVLKAFSAAIGKELDEEKCTLESYCLKYRRRSGRPDAYWSPASNEEPYFFGCLWLTCLVASGYPPEEGQFYNRMKLVLGRRSSGFSARDSGSFEDVWEDLADWTKRHHERYRELLLPPRDTTYRKHIGRSFYLAFPNHADRLRLRAALERADLLVDDPPIRLVLEVLRRSRQDFGKDFQQELDSFFDKYLHTGRDPRESPFWRAVVQQASAPSLDRTGGAERTGQSTLMARFDQDDLLEFYIACTEQYPDKHGFIREPLGFEAGEFRYRLVPQAPSSSQRLAFDQLLTGTSRRTFARGVVPLLRVISGEYRLAQGEELAECERAVVRNDRVEAFIREFGGKKNQSALPDWQEIEGCQLRQLDSLPKGLEDVSSLLHTTVPQRPHFVGGIRTSTGGFYRLNGYLPRIHAPGAEKVEVATAGLWLPCRRIIDEQQVEEWLLPTELDLEALQKLQVAATWRVHIEDYVLERRGEAEAALDALSIAIDHKGLPSGDFWLETASRRLETLRGPAEEVPLGFTTRDSTRTMDMVFFDATARWLGPGVGEMSLVPKEDFPWLAFGPNNSPTMVVFVGDARRPVLPNGDFSPLSKDRRHWKKAFSGGASSVLVREGTEYVPLDERPEVRAIHSAYVEAACSTAQRAGSACAPTDLDRCFQETERASGDYSKEATLLLDVLSSIAHTRSGIPLREVHEHLARITDTDEYHSLRLHLLRALEEMGAIDTLLRMNGRQKLVVARRPRLVVSRRANRFSATVLGLLPQKIALLLEKESKNRGLLVTYAAPPNRFQPPIIHLEAKNGCLEPLVALSRELAFVPPEFLDWPDAAQVPRHFTVRDELERDTPPEVYKPEAAWCWKTGAFLRTPEEPGEIGIERRSDGQRAPIYVILRAGTPVSWSYSRAWALLDAAEKAGRPPFTRDENGVLETLAHAPIHLPLPLARLCTAIGAGAPGPRIAEREGRRVVTSYVYPFGRKLAPLAARAVPESWTQRKVE